MSTKTFILKNCEKHLDDIPNEPGIYYIKTTKKCNPKIEKDFSRRIKNHSNLDINDLNGPYSLTELKDKMKLTSKGVGTTLYIGKAANLNRRLRQYMNYLYGKGNSHRGGRAIGQIIGFDELICEYHCLPSREDAEDRERSELCKFKKNNKSLPLANWRL